MPGFLSRNLISVSGDRPRWRYAGQRMTYVVTSNCQGCRFTDCVCVCPVNCFHGDGQMLYINPDVCIDCGACVPECPVEAIYDEAALPSEEVTWLETNAERAPRLPVISEREQPLATALARKRKLGF
jgi:ferredoxin